MNRNRMLRLFTFLGIMILLLSACGAKSEKSTDDAGTSDGSAIQPGNGSEVTGTTTESDSKADFDDTTENLTYTSTVTNNETVLNSQDKIIRRFSLEVETQDFDDLVVTIDSQINLLGGYIETSNISGRSYYYSNSMRYGNIVVRVPKDRIDEFIYTVNDVANVINSQETAENVTLQYVDTQSHKKALEIEQERLLALLEKVETLEDIITLEGRLSSVRYELQSYETQLRTYDNLVDYSTVTLNIQEVERMTPVSEEKVTVWNTIKTGFGDSMYNIGEGLKNFVVWFVVSLPYLIIWVVIIALATLIGRRLYRKSIIKNAPQEKAKLPKQDNEKKDGCS